MNKTSAIQQPPIQRTAAVRPVSSVGEMIQRECADCTASSSLVSRLSGSPGVIRQETGSPMIQRQTGTQGSCPVSAIFLSTLVGSEKDACRVPAGKNGISTLAQFRLMGIPQGSTPMVNEQFTMIDDPYSIFSKLVPKGAQTTPTGIFNDCYMIYTDQPLPPDFRLKVMQNHLVNGDIVDKNEITYTSTGVRVCNHARLPGTCDFSNRCK